MNKNVLGLNQQISLELQMIYVKQENEQLYDALVCVYK